MKKILVILLILLMSFSLISCSAADYKLATKLYEEGDYKQAAVFYETAAKYKDSQEMLTLCKYYLAKMAIDKEEWNDAATYLIGLNYEDSEELLKSCYMHTNQDYAFLQELETLMNFRLHQAEIQGIGAQELITTEYECVKKYDLETFYDFNLKQIESDLLNGLTLLYESYDNISLLDSQAKTYQAQALLCQAYSKLYESYDFLKDDEDFVRQYVNALKSSQENALASVSIRTDIDEQLMYLSNTGTPWHRDGNKLTLTITNNTIYSYTLEMHISYFDSGGTLYYSDSSSIKFFPNESNTFSFSINTPSIFNTLATDYIYTDIFKNE